MTTGLIERENAFTMKDFAASVDKFLAFNEYRILDGKGGVSKAMADAKAVAEYAKFNRHQKIESDFDREVKKLIEENSKLKRGPIETFAPVIIK